MREASNKVYLFAKDSLEEEVLYDFTLEVGDTIKGYLQSLSYINHYPKPFLSLFQLFLKPIFSGQSHRLILYLLILKQQYINRHVLCIIEGVGSGNDSLGVLALGNSVNYWVRLECFILNKKIIYDNYGYAND